MEDEMYETYAEALDWDEEFDVFDDLDEEDDEFLSEDFDELDGDSELGEVLRGLLSDDYADALPEELDEALSNIFDSMTLAEGFNLGSAFKSLGTGASQLLAEPTFGQIVRTAAPVVAGAAGGPLASAAASSLLTQVPLGTAAAKALPTAGKGVPSPASPVAGGSLPATRALMLMHDPNVLTKMAELALGQVARKSGGPVDAGSMMTALSTLFSQAAEDADALLYASEEAPPDPIGEESVVVPDPWAPADRAESVYADLLAASNAEWTEALGWR
jgi:hypothetical protein